MIDELRVVTVTTFFPNSAEPHRTVFLRHLVRAMRRVCPVDVVAPLPYAPPLSWIPRWHALNRVARIEMSEEIQVQHPRFVAIPKLPWLSGMGYFLGVILTLRRLMRSTDRCVLHAHCAYPDGVGVALAARFLGIPFVITAHGSDINVYSKRRTLWPQIRWALGSARGVIVVSRDLEAKVKKLTGSSIRNLSCIPCAGYDPAIFSPRRRQEARAAIVLSPDARLIVFVGNLVPIKGVDVLIAAWRLLRERKAVGSTDRLLIIGDGTARPALERLSLAQGDSDTIVFYGALPQSSVSQHIAAADVLCLPSHNEGMPNVVVEALALGIPVVASRVGGIPELLNDGVNGLLVEPGRPDALANRLAEVFARSWDRAKIHSSVSHLTWQAIGARNAAFIANVLAC